MVVPKHVHILYMFRARAWSDIPHLRVGPILLFPAPQRVRPSELRRHPQCNTATHLFCSSRPLACTPYEYEYVAVSGILQAHDKKNNSKKVDVRRNKPRMKHETVEKHINPAAEYEPVLVRFRANEHTVRTKKSISHHRHLLY